jgi:6-phospho-3-hexuloisomerase
MDFAKTGADALAEIREALARINLDEAEALVVALAKARRIALYGVGREGLMIKALAMRLYHLGLDAHVVGDMTTPPVGKGDLLLVSAGPGMFSTVAGLVSVARKAGAATACFTAQPDAVVPRMCDHVLVLPAQTMASDRGAHTSVLPMGSLYEGVQFIVGELLVMMLAEKGGVDPRAMRANHTNLE